MPTNTTQKKDAALDDVLNQNIEATEQIKAAANELGVVHAVLSTPIPPQSAEGDLEAAVERTEEIEQQLNETAESDAKFGAALQAGGRKVKREKGAA